MSSLMDRLPYTSLLIFYCFTIACDYGRGQELSPSCEVGLMVQRGTMWKTAPRQRLTLRCPVKHCGESLNVTWCKELDTNKCERINFMENVEINQNDMHATDELISFLTFKRISVYDGGLYRCFVKGHGYEVVSHTINISVSDLNQGVQNSDNGADELPPVAGDEGVPWLPYISICLSIALLVATLTVLTLLNTWGWRRLLNLHRTKEEEISTHSIPDLPMRNITSTFFLQTLPTPPSQPSPMTSGNQAAAANTVDESQGSDRAVYAVINHRQAGTPARERHTETTQNEDIFQNSEYAAINVT
ncbi:B- and T-lymphocyte attenuator [Chelmon rostratus]|uniref:B- and T-lymphocyte attenuator n=1 Tax=Chelmon rostratus TaxID=109905 RepID=UPI001BE8B954|nr:B- and T-lymphocyte attenuator [Chelmon rostratus]